MRLFSFLLLFLFLSSCVSNKKHRAALDSLTTAHQAQVQQLEYQVDTSRAKIFDLQLQLAERKGENNVLVGLRDELQSRIDHLEQQMESMGSRSESQEQQLRNLVLERDQSIQELKQQLRTTMELIDQQESVFKQLNENITEAFSDHTETAIQVYRRYDQLAVALSQDSLFRRNSATRLLDDGYVLLEKISGVLERYPNYQVYITGHTDNRPPKDSRRYKDNWNFSALQAATVVKTMIDEYDLSTSQLMIAAKGEFAPRSSNATKEGQAINRRIEFVIVPPIAELARKIREAVDLSKGK